MQTQINRDKCYFKFFTTPSKTKGKKISAPLHHQRYSYPKLSSLKQVSKICQQAPVQGLRRGQYTRPG